MHEMRFEELFPKASYAVGKFEGGRFANVCSSLKTTERTARDVARRMNRLYARQGRDSVSYEVIRILRD